MKRVRTFRISDENYEEVRNYVRQTEGIVKEKKKLMASKKETKKILEWLFENRKTLEDIKEAFRAKKALEGYKAFFEIVNSNK